MRVTPEEKEKLEFIASAFAISVGALCRGALLKLIPKSKTDLNAIQELAATRADLGRLGGLLKGWLAGSFPPGVPQPSTHQDVISLLHQIQEAQKLVVESVKKVAGKP